MQLTEDVAARFARLALGHVTREYPHSLTHVLSGPDDVRAPRELHPVFYGSFDWHSCVHAYWMLARLLGLFPDRLSWRWLLVSAIADSCDARRLPWTWRSLTAG